MLYDMPVALHADIRSKTKLCLPLVNNGGTFARPKNVKRTMKHWSSVGQTEKHSGTGIMS